jgi:hypothetical protein
MDEDIAIKSALDKIPGYLIFYNYSLSKCQNNTFNNSMLTYSNMFPVYI